jgi:hypothetical protein
MPGGSVPPKLTLHSYKLIGRWGGDIDRYASCDLVLRLLALVGFAAVLLVFASR